MLNQFSRSCSAAHRYLPWGLALVGTVAIAPSLPQEIAQAQSSGDASELGEWQTNERDTRSVGSTGLTPLELIQRMRSLSGQSPAEFDAQQEGRLDDAASDFRRQQQQRLGGSDPTTPAEEDL